MASPFCKENGQYLKPFLFTLQGCCPFYYLTNQIAALCFFTLSFFTFRVCLTFPMRDQSVFLPINIEQDIDDVFFR